MTATAWADRAVCRTVKHPAIFFPEDDAPYRATVEARSICHHCPVQLECLEYALGREELGIWGGTTAIERRRIRRRRRDKAA